MNDFDFYRGIENLKFLARRVDDIEKTLINTRRALQALVEEAGDIHGCTCGPCAARRAAREIFEGKSAPSIS